MPIPKPQENESKTEFIDRCIQAILDEDPDKTQEQASAIAYDIWSNSKNARSLYDELIERFDKIRDVLTKTLGKRGEALLNYTLIRLGVFDPSLKKFNMAALDGNMNLPFLKYEDDGSATVGNLIAPFVEFTKFDKEANIVEGYANTITIDTYSDIFLPEAYRESFEQEYIVKKRPIYLMHHEEIPAGNLVELRFDDIGMFCKSSPNAYARSLIDNGTIKGYSIGFSFKIWPDQVGNSWVTHKKHSVYGYDISYVTNPANLASYFTSIPEDDMSVKARTEKLLSNPKAAIKDKPTLKMRNAIKDDSEIANSSQSRKLTDDNTLSVVAVNGLNVEPQNKILKESKKLSEKQSKKYDSMEQCIADGKTEAECKLLLKSADKKFVEKTTEELMNMSPAEQMKYMEELAEYRFKVKNIQNIRAAEESVKEAAQVDRFKSFENMVAQLKTAIDELSTEVKSIKGTLKIHDEKMIKFEDEVADIALTPPPTAPTVNAQKLAQTSGNFGEFIAKVEKRSA